MLTPEKCIQKQFRIGADVMFCLDHCTHPGEDQTAQKTSVAHTIEWARRCKAAFEDRLKLKDEMRPLLFGVVQGGEDRDLRQQCAECLLEIGFDGYGYGGWVGVFPRRGGPSATLRRLLRAGTVAREDSPKEKAMANATAVLEGLSTLRLHLYLVQAAGAMAMEGTTRATVSAGRWDKFK